MMYRPIGPQLRTPRTAFTLLEAMIALVIMSLTVTALSMAIGGGRQHATEAVDQLQGVMAAEALLSEVTATDYASLESYDGRDEAPGSMKTFEGVDYPESFYRVGRRVAVIELLKTIPGFDVKVQGKEVAVEAYDLDGRTLVTLVVFVVEPGA